MEKTLCRSIGCECFQGELGRCTMPVWKQELPSARNFSRSHSTRCVQSNVYAGSQNNTEVGQCLSSFEAPALQVRDSYRVGSQANLSATGKNGYKQKSQLKRMFLRWMRRVYGLYKVPSKRASATVSAFVI